MPRSHRPSIRGKRYVVSSVHYLATMGGVRILESGGNAADAGVAVGICINVLQPGFTHFGGVAPIIYCPGSGAPVETISGLGRFPRRRASITSENITTAICPPEFCELLRRHRPMRG